MEEKREREWRGVELASFLIDSLKNSREFPSDEFKVDFRTTSGQRGEQISAVVERGSIRINYTIIKMFTRIVSIVRTQLRHSRGSQWLRPVDAARRERRQSLDDHNSDPLQLIDS